MVPKLPASQVAAQLRETKPHLFAPRPVPAPKSNPRAIPENPEIKRLQPGVFEIQGRTGVYQIIDGQCNCPGAWYAKKCWHLPAVRVWAKANPVEAPKTPAAAAPTPFTVPALKTLLQKPPKPPTVKQSMEALERRAREIEQEQRALEHLAVIEQCGTVTEWPEAA